MIRAINAARRPVLALDIPSGVDADSGAVHEEAVRAELTVSFVGFKSGLFLGDGPEHAGVAAARRSRRGGPRAAAIRAAHAAHRRKRTGRGPAAPRARRPQGFERPRAGGGRRRGHAGRAAPGGRCGAARGRGPGHGCGRRREPGRGDGHAARAHLSTRRRGHEPRRSPARLQCRCAMGPGLGTGDWARRLWSPVSIAAADPPWWSMPTR